MFRKTVWLFVYCFIGTRFNISLSRAQGMKTWNKNTNFANPRNWENGVVPCANDKAVFPSEAPVITYMPESFTLAEIMLPMNAELIFPENATIFLTGGNQEGSCIGKELIFKAAADSWYSSTNWNITSDFALPHISSRRNAAVPHAFQVPCRMDTVRFPTKTSFRVLHDYPSTSIAALKINDIEFTNDQFQSLLQTPTGKLLFPNNPEIHISSAQCSDETGCACENDDPMVLPTICMFEVPCPVLDCSDPINVAGHCCDICGSKIVVKFQAGFKLDQLFQLHLSFLGKIKYWGVESFTSKTYDGTIQSVFVDGTSSKGLASEVSKLIYDALIADIEGPELYKILTVELHRSQLWGPDVPMHGRLTTSGVSSGGIAAIVIIIIILLGLAAAFYIYKKRQITGFSFARFDLRSEKIELELDTTPHEELQPVDPAGPKESAEKSNAFDNPVYGTDIVSEVEEDEESVEGRNFVENPMFMIFEDSSGKTENRET